MTTEEIMEKAGKVIEERSQIKEKELTENEILIKAIDEKLKELREQMKELTKKRRLLVNRKEQPLNDVSKYYGSKIAKYRAINRWYTIEYHDRFDFIREKAVLTATNGRTKLTSGLVGDEIDKAKEIGYALVNEWYPEWVKRNDAVFKSVPAPKKK